MRLVHHQHKVNLFLPLTQFDNKAVRLQATLADRIVSTFVDVLLVS